MIDKKILEQMGFKKGSGWDHEVWHYDGDFWVHFNGDYKGLRGTQISGDASMEEFFSMFIERIQDCVIRRAHVVF